MPRGVSEPRGVAEGREGAYFEWQLPGIYLGRRPGGPKSRLSAPRIKHEELDR